MPLRSRIQWCQFEEHIHHTINGKRREIMNIFVLVNEMSTSFTSTDQTQTKTKQKMYVTVLMGTLNYEYMKKW